MAKKETAPVRTKLEEVNDSLTNTAQKLEKNKKLISIIVGSVLALVVLGAGYYYLIYKPAKAQAEELVGMADFKLIMKNDVEGALKDYKEAAGDYNRANFNAAIILYQQGKYDEALEYLDNYKPKGTLVGPAALSLKGDCYVNKKDYDNAIEAYDEAIKKTDGNELYAPTFMCKKATVLHAQKKYGEEAEIYQTIKDQFPNYAGNSGFELDKYLERAKALAGK